MIIDCRSYGIVDGTYNGNLICTESDLNIKIPLRVTGDIFSSGNINVFDSDICVDGGINTCGDLNSDKNIISGSSIYAGGDIKAKGNILANCNIKAGGSILSTGNVTGEWGISSGKDIYVDGKIISNRDIYFIGEISSKNISMCGVKSTSLLIISGLPCRVWVLDDHIKIGCEIKTKKEWVDLEESDAETIEYHDVLKYRDIIFNISKIR